MLPDTMFLLLSPEDVPSVTGGKEEQGVCPVPPQSRQYRLVNVRMDGGQYWARTSDLLRVKQAL